MSLSSQDGFSLVEVLMSASILVVGLMGTMTMITGADSATITSRTREAGVNLQRELIEAARSIPYDQLTPNSIGPLVRQQAGLADSNQGSAGWTVRRRGVTYTISMGTCAVDDPRDGIGSHQAGVFCANGAGTASPQDCLALLRTSGTGMPGENASDSATAGDCGLDTNYDGQVDGLVDMTGTSCGATCGGGQADSNPADYKRIVSLVRWEHGTGARWVLQSTTIANPGLSAAPGVISLTQGIDNPVQSATSITFTAGTSSQPSAVSWYLDGTSQGAATGGPLTWSFTWGLGVVSSGSQPNQGEVLDGSYQIGAKAFDQYGQAGTARSVTVILNRRAPYPPQNLEAGRNGGVVELEWAPNKERDIEGYRVYRTVGGGSPVLVCPLTDRTACQDPAPPATGAASYYAVAVDKDAAGALREGQASAVATISTTNTPPPPPQTLSASTSAGNTILAWTPPATGDPDPGDSIDHYVIYRDGQAFDDRYDRTSSGSELTYTDTHTGGQVHTYWVAAVDTQLAESTKVGPVSR